MENLTPICMRAELSLSNISKSIFGGDGVRCLADSFESETCLHSFNYIKSLIRNISEVSSFTSMLFASQSVSANFLEFVRGVFTAGRSSEMLRRNAARN